jgi:putative heme-binding domain-containing protein
VGDEGTDYAPNLTGWARRQTTEVLVQSIITPSAEIAHGFGGVELIAKDGTEIHGIVVTDGDPVVVQSAAGLVQTVPKAKIKSRKPLGRSLMMSADQLGLTPQDLADIAVYLKTQ